MEALVKILGVIVLIIIVVVLCSFPVMWLWNWLMPIIFELPKITIWQAIGLSFLARLLFGASSVKASKK